MCLHVIIQNIPTTGRRMFTRRLRTPNPNGDLLDRTRRQMHAPTDTDVLDTIEQILGLRGETENKSQRIIEKIKYMQQTHNTIHESLRGITEYETKLESLIEESRRNEKLPEQILSAWNVLHRAENEVKHLTSEICSLRGSLEAKQEEVRQLRSRLSKAENSRISERVDVMKSNLVEGSESRRRASETLITAYEESERIRVTLEKEVIKLKSMVETAQKHLSEEMEEPTFTEIARLEEINRQLIRATAHRDRKPVTDEPRAPRPKPSFACFDSLSEIFYRELEHESNEPNYTVRYRFARLHVR